MFNLTGRFVRGYLSILVILYGTIFFMVTVFSFKHGSFLLGVMMAIALTMSALSVITVPFTNKNIFPIIPNKFFWGTVLVIVFLANGAYFVLGKEKIDSQKGLFSSKVGSSVISDQVATGKEKTYSIKGCYVYYPNGEKREGKDGRWVMKETKVRFLENISIGDGAEAFALVMLANNAGHFYQGEKVMVPVSSLEKKPQSQTQASGGISKKEEGKSLLESVKGVFSKAPSETKGVVILTPEQVKNQDLYGDSDDKLKLYFPGFDKGDIVEFEEDFFLRTTGKSSHYTVLFADNRRIKKILGDYIPKGTRFQVRENSPTLLFSSVGARQVSFSSLKLKKIN